MTEPLSFADAAITYGPTGIRCGCGRDAHSNLSPCRADLTSRVRHVAITLDLENAPQVAWPWGPNNGDGDGWVVPGEIVIGYTRWPRGGRITVYASTTGNFRDADGTMTTDSLRIELDRLPGGLPGWAQELVDQNMPFDAAGNRMCACNADEAWMHNTTCPRGILTWHGQDWHTNGYYADADGFVWCLCSVLPTGEPLFTPLAGDLDVSMPLADVLAEGGPLTLCPRPDDQPNES